ncbi:MAG TPA: beta-ketoacyl synthase chain length factor [Chitinophagaceae bacterium]|nr:beta-ketoacyl synthase chain length factor [Chitinophagaceae bacterium]
MFYIHQTSSISPQHSPGNVDLNVLFEPVDKKLHAIEPVYGGIPPGVLRRMGKAVRMGVGAALPLLYGNTVPDGIIIGTTDSGKEDSAKFLNQIVDYDEGMLTPLNFVQSTPNAVAAQIGLLTKNHGYNITHLQPGLAFEFAMIDADMMLQENPLNNYLLGAVDDISERNYCSEEKAGWHKKENISNKILYETNSPGSIAGEAATMFLVNGNEVDPILKVHALDTLHHEEELVVKEKIQGFIKKYLPAGEKIDLLLTGENGDNRLLKYYSSCESVVNDDVAIARFKHMSGEFPTAIAMGLCLCCELLPKQTMPDHMLKRKGSAGKYKNTLIYNNYRGTQHGFMLVSVP